MNIDDQINVILNPGFLDEGFMDRLRRAEAAIPEAQRPAFIFRVLERGCEIMRERIDMGVYRGEDAKHVKAQVKKAEELMAHFSKEAKQHANRN